MVSDDFRVGGCQLQHELVGQFTRSDVNDSQDIRAHLADEGYVFLRGVLDVGEVLAAREEVFSRLAGVGEIKLPAIEGIATGQSQRRELTGNLVEFWRSVSEGPALRKVTHEQRVRDIMEIVFGETARPQDYLWLRPRPVGWLTGLHHDHPFFARGSERVHTVWIPLGDVPISDGPLTLVEDSHHFSDLIYEMRERDEEVINSPQAAIQAAFAEKWQQDIAAFLQQRGKRILSADLSAGDIVIFGMDIMHGSLDNQSPIGRVRLSCDVRYQPASDPLDARYFGRNPTGASGDGYGDMNSCRPLTET